MVLSKIDVNLATLVSDFSDFTFIATDKFYWSGSEKQIYYDQNLISSKQGLFQLLHELGHGLLEHADFSSAVQLLKMEQAAWQKAREIARRYGISIDENMVENSLDTYRDWLHQRSLCPQCHATAIETMSNRYRCFNCGQKWRVPDDQRRRCYRKKLVSG